MRYEITYQVAGEEHTDEVDAPDAASAAAAVQELHGRTPDLFELIQVHLLDEPTGSTGNQPADDASASAG